MTALYIILGIVLFLLILLIIPLSFYFKYDGEPELTLRYLFIKIKLVPQKEKPEKHEAKKEKQTGKPENKKPEKKESLIKELYKKQGLDGLLEILSELTDILKDTSARLAGHVVVRRLGIDLLIVGEDAADTAMKYAYCCAAVYPAVSLAESCIDLRKKEINLEPGFNEKETKVFAEARADIKPCFAIAAAASAFFRGIKLISKLK